MKYLQKVQEANYYQTPEDIRLKVIELCDDLGLKCDTEEDNDYYLYCINAGKEVVSLDNYLDDLESFRQELNKENLKVSVVTHGVTVYYKVLPKR